MRETKIYGYMRVSSKEQNEDRRKESQLQKREELNLDVLHSHIPIIFKKYIGIGGGKR